jgi:DNA-binding GntR family transcriptional regulator
VKGDQKRKRGRPKATSDVPISGSRALERDSLVPLYFQLAVALTERIEAGSWEAGARFATEREIEEEFRVSRSVVRRALELLVGDGLIVRVRGAGAFLTTPRNPVVVSGVIKTLLEPHGVTLDVLALREEPPDPTLADLLKIDRAPTSVAHLTAVLRVGQDSVGLVDSYSRASLLSGLLPALRALKAEAASPPTLGALELTRARVPIELTHFGEWGSAQVGVSAGDPALRGTMLQFGRLRGRREQPLELAHLVYRTDNVQLAIELD